MNLKFSLGRLLTTNRSYFRPVKLRLPVTAYRNGAYPVTSHCLFMDGVQLPQG